MNSLDVTKSKKIKKLAYKTFNYMFLIDEILWSWIKGGFIAIFAFCIVYIITYPSESKYSLFICLILGAIFGLVISLLETKLKRTEVLSKTYFKESVEKYLIDDDWHIWNNNQRYLYASKSIWGLRREDSKIIIIYDNDSVLYCSLVPVPFPFCLFYKKQIKYVIEASAKAANKSLKRD